MKRLFFFLLAGHLWLAPVFSQEIIELGSLPAPEGLVWENPEQQGVNGDLAIPIVSNVSKPTLTAYLPDPDKATGTALIIAPGGGFHFLAIEHEGTDVAEWCVEQGIAAFVLRYRLVPTGENPVAEFTQKFQSDQEKLDRDMAPFIALAKADGLAAIEYVRTHAQDMGIQSDQIGIVGFSAGGTVAAAAAYEHTSSTNRPDFAAPIYAALHVVDTEKMPADPMPLFLAVASDDSFGFQTLSVNVYQQWNAAGEPIEVHIYQSGGHGFGMRKQNLTSDHWIEAFKAWMKLNGML